MLDKKNIETGIKDEHRELFIKFIQVFYPHVKIILFGSRARGIFRPGSDIDLALDIGKKIDPYIKTLEIKDVLSALRVPYSFDVVDLRAVSADMRKIIEEEGISWT